MDKTRGAVTAVPAVGGYTAVLDNSAMLVAAMWAVDDVVAVEVVVEDDGEVFPAVMAPEVCADLTSLAEHAGH